MRLSIDSSSSSWRITFCVGVFWMYGSKIMTDAACGRPGRTSNIIHEPGGDIFNTNDKIRYRCSSTDRIGLIIGDAERECMRNGSWSGKMPICLSSVKIEEAELSTEYHEEDYNPSYDGNISTCEQTSATFWEGSLSAPKSIFAVQIILLGKEEVEIETLVKSDTSPEVTCRTETKTEDKNGIFVMVYCPHRTVGKYIHIRSLSQPLTICEILVLLPPAQNCLTPDIPANGNGRLIFSAIHNKYHFSCHSGYQLFGTATAICQSDGTWSPSSPNCEKIFCHPPSSPINGKVEYDLVNSRLPYNGEAKYSCDDGFYLEGESTIVCHRYDQWNASEPICRRRRVEVFHDSKDQLTCGKFPDVVNGAFMSNSTTVGSIGLLKCNLGFRPVTDNHIYCLQTGSWNPKSLLCTAIQCESHPLVPNGAAFLLNNSSYYGFHLQIICNQGFIPHDPVIRTCDELGTWGNLNICTEITCGDFIHDDLRTGQWITLDETTSVRILICADGFHIEGTPPITRCLANGSWSYTSANCKKSNTWSSTVNMIAAVSAGIIVAVIILCSSIAFLIIGKRRRQSKQNEENITVFHLEKLDSYSNTGKEQRNLKKHHSTRDYEDCVELRSKLPYTNPRKPHSALPNLPIDADPVYAQPFEPAGTKKISVPLCKNDLYNTHIYAEPVNSRTQSLYANDISQLRSESKPDVSTLKISLRNGSTAGLGCDKKCAIYDTSSKLESNQTMPLNENC